MCNFNYIPQKHPNVWFYTERKIYRPIEVRFLMGIKKREHFVVLEAIKNNKSILLS